MVVLINSTNVTQKNNFVELVFLNKAVNLLAVFFFVSSATEMVNYQVFGIVLFTFMLILKKRYNFHINIDV